MTNANEQPWWINATDRPPAIKAIEDALVDAGLCRWDGQYRPHPQSYALVAYWAMRVSTDGDE